MLDDAGRWPSFGAAEEDRELAILVLALRWLEHCTHPRMDGSAG